MAAGQAEGGALVARVGPGQARQACGGAAGGRPTPPNNAVERTGHSVRFLAHGSQYIVARPSPRALGIRHTTGEGKTTAAAGLTWTEIPLSQVLRQSEQPTRSVRQH